MRPLSYSRQGAAQANARNARTVEKRRRPPAERSSGLQPAPCYRLHVSLPLVVMGVGTALIVVTFLLAFTIFGEVPTGSVQHRFKVSTCKAY